MKRFAYSLRFFGSKSYQLQQIMDEIITLDKNGYYDTFVEVFAGSGRLTFALPDGMFKLKVYNDKDKALVNLMNVLINDDKRKALIYVFKHLPWSRDIFEYMKEYVDKVMTSDIIGDELKFALATYYIHGYSFMGKGNTMGYFINSWRNIGKENLEVLYNFNSNNIDNVVIENLDFEDVINKYDNEKTIFYLDPPYIRESSIYRCGFTIDDYYKLSEILKNVDGKYIMNISMHDTVDVVDIFGKPNYIIDYKAHAYITNESRPSYGMGFWRN